MPKSASPRLIVFSGAGLSAESGLPTFRGATGLWEGVPIETVCYYPTWQRNYVAVHAFYDARRLAEAQAEPNQAHRTVAGWQKRWPDRTTILTQNIDRLLERAGGVDLVKLHGDVRTMQCEDCAHRWEIEPVVYDQSGCPSCHSDTVKPGVVFFSEPAPRYSDLHGVVARLRAQDTVVVIGTSGTVLPADRLFAYSDACSILVNLEPGSAMDEQAFTERFYGPATQMLPRLNDLLVARMAAA